MFAIKTYYQQPVLYNFFTLNEMGFYPSLHECAEQGRVLSLGMQDVGFDLPFLVRVEQEKVCRIARFERIDRQFEYPARAGGPGAIEGVLVDLT